MGIKVVDIFPVLLLIKYTTVFLYKLSNNNTMYLSYHLNTLRDRNSFFVDVCLGPKDGRTDIESTVRRIE